MFTKADYLNYLYVLSERESDLASGLHALAGSVADPAVSGKLQALIREKQEAQDLINRLFSRLFGMAAEQRRYKRGPALGDVKLRNLETGETVLCRCLDISLGGMCVQLSSELQPGVLAGLEVRFFESRRPIVRRGEVRWCSRGKDGQYRAGLQFLDQ